jgi:exopolysaccharide production protein ExoZ
MKALSIQYLRAVAALGVVVYHSGIEADWANTWPLKGFAGGVDVFFVISGFIMWITTDRRGVGSLEFWRRRLERIVPLYWMVTSIAVLIALVSPRLGGQTTPWHVFSSYAFLPAANPDTMKVEPLVSPGWTLNYEMFFYAIFGAALILSIGKRLAATLGLLCGTVVLAAVLPHSALALDFYGDSIVIEFAFGMLLGAAFTRSYLHVPEPVAWAGIATGIAFFALLSGMAHVPRVIAFGLPSLLIVASAVFLERGRAVPEWRLPKLLGDASYSIYLSHSIFMGVLGTAWNRIGLPPRQLFPVGLIGAAIVGVTVYRLVEVPIMARIRLRRRRADRVAATDSAVVAVTEAS